MNNASHRRLSGYSVLIALIGFLVMGGCNALAPSSSGPQPSPYGSGLPPGDIVQSSKARLTLPYVPDADSAELAAGNTAFALDLYQQARQRDGNIFFSPHSISIALAMTYAGARAETEEQMADTLMFTLPQDRLHSAFNALDLALAGRGQTVTDDDTEPFRLNVVNRIWGQIGYSFLAEFLDTLAENYGASLSLLDFADDASRVAINGWVTEQTEGRIEDLIPAGGITGDTRLVLTNAIYFLADWGRPFDRQDTGDGPFNLLDGSEVTASMMQQEASFGYAAGDDYQAIELPYEGNEISMVIFLPEAGAFEPFEETLDAERVSAIVEDLSELTVNLTMPKFTFEWEASLGNALGTMGMEVAFSGAADFSGMNGQLGLLIQDVIHKAFVAVDEEGTEAAAATAVIMGEGAAPPAASVAFHADRPFIFLIRDRETEAILFLGRVVDPR